MPNAAERLRRLRWDTGERWLAARSNQPGVGHWAPLERGVLDAQGQCAVQKPERVVVIRNKLRGHPSATLAPAIGPLVLS